MKTTTDRVFAEGINWLAQNTENNTAASDAIRLLAYLVDTTEEWIWQAVGHQQEAIAANDRKTQERIVTPGGSVECPHCHWGFAPTVIDQHIHEKH